MKDLNIQWIKLRVSGRSSTVGAYIKLTHNKSGAGRKSLCFTIYEQAMSDLRWQVGDRVEVGDAGQCFALKRVVTGGFAVSAVIGKRTKTKTATVQLTREDVENEIDKTFFTKEQILLMPNGVVLIPKRK